MQIDVLSQNTLKLTLSRLDMFDLDIKYESLSGKNPDTKRLLSHVLRTVRLDKGSGIDFSGERLFVEAFPRPDGGCMLYISCLLEQGDERERGREGETADSHGKVNVAKRTVRLTAKPAIYEHQQKQVKSQGYPVTEKCGFLCRLDSIKELGGVCKGLSWQLNNGRLFLESALYNNRGEYRLFLRSDNKKLISAIVSEYGGDILDLESELPFTYEHYTLLVPENAVEKMDGILYGEKS
ncbi:MAG: adaptor protein MecA [Oscillospiraceae bacterium]|nr:adaptor protein MecA [Oscillospiraceae bacterium]